MDHDWELGTCCFAGANEELVVAASRYKDLNVRSAPNDRLNTIALDHLVRLPSGADLGITAIGYSKHRSTLISCAFTMERSKCGLLSNCPSCLIITTKHALFAKVSKSIFFSAFSHSLIH